jgi:hypothetical protein
LTKATLETLGWEIMNQPPYILVLESSDFYLFEPIKVQLEGQKYQTDDELICGVLNWLCSQDKPFMLLASVIS